MDELTELDVHLQRWSVPSDVRDALHRAVESISRDGIALSGEIGDDLVTLAVRGQPVALYLSPSRVSAALAPTDAERAHRADSALGLEKQSESTWLVHCRYGRLDSSRLNAMAALIVRALRRHAPAATSRTGARKTTSGRTSGGRTPAGPTTPRRSAEAAPTRAKEPSARTVRAKQEERRRAADAVVPRCPVPGCNLPMVGGSCGFHD